MANQQRKTYVGVLLTQEEYAALEDLATREHRSKSSAIKIALLSYLDRMKTSKKAS